MPSHYGFTVTAKGHRSARYNQGLEETAFVVIEISALALSWFYPCVFVPSHLWPPPYRSCQAWLSNLCSRLLLLSAAMPGPTNSFFTQLSVWMRGKTFAKEVWLSCCWLRLEPRLFEAKGSRIKSICWTWAQSRVWRNLSLTWKCLDKFSNALQKAYLRMQKATSLPNFRTLFQSMRHLKLSSQTV